MANSLGSNTPLGLAEFLAAVQAELGDHADADENHLRFRVDGVTLEVDVSSTLSISPESPRRLSVHLNRTPEARAVGDEPDAVAMLPASQAPPTDRSK